MTSRNVDIVIAVIMFAFGAWVLALTGSIRLGSVVGVVGPKFFPEILAAIIMSMSVLLGINGLRAKREQGPSEPVVARSADGMTASERFLKNRAVRVSMLLCLVSGYVFALGLLGYRISSIIFISLLLLFKGMRNPLWVGITSAALALVLYVLFHMLLAIPLPVGSLTDVR